MRKIRMLISDERLGYKAGEVYECSAYRFDPDKLTADRKVPDDGVEPSFNVYKESVGYEFEYVK